MAPRVSDARLEFRQDGPLEHFFHFVGDTGQREDNPLAERADQPGGRSETLGDDPGSDRHLGLTLVARRHLPVTSVKGLLDEREGLAVALERDPHDLGDRLPGDVVLCRSQSSADDDRIGRGTSATSRTSAMRATLSPTRVW